MANGVIGKVTAGGGTHLVTSTFYGTCTTAANVAAKIVKLADATPDSATLITGMLLAVRFTNANSVANPSLTIQRNANTTNLIGAKPIVTHGSTTAGTTIGTSWRAGAVILFVFDGTNWVITDYNEYSIHQNAAITTSGAYNILGGASANDDEQIGSVNKLSGLTYNPSTHNLTNNGAKDTAYYIQGNSTTYGRMFINAIGTAGTAKTFTNPDNETQTVTGYTGNTQGVMFLELGNNKAVGTNGTSYSSPGTVGNANNAKGYLRIYSEGANYSEIVAQANGSHTVFLPNHNSNMYLVHAGNNNAVGSASKPVYVAANGRVTEGTSYGGGSLVKLNNTSKAGAEAAFYAPTAGGTAGQYLKANGATAAPTWASFVKPEVTWAAGTTAGPTLSVKATGGTSTAVAVPSASGSASGIVTTGTQTFAGAKTFTQDLTISKSTTIANNYAATLNFSVTQTDNNKTTGAYIKVYDDADNQNYGTNMVIQSTGAVIVGGGESPSALYGVLGKTYTQENLFLTADGSIFAEANANTIANRIGFQIDTSGNLLPVKAEAKNNNIQSLGVSGAAWKGLYLGNASSAYNENGVIFSGGSRLGENTNGDIGLYAARKLYIKPLSATAASSIDGILIDGDGLYPVVDNTESLGLSTNKWANIHATTVTLGQHPTSNFEAATKYYVDNIIATNDAMVFKGTLAGGTTTTYTPAANRGWTYKVSTAGLINKDRVEIGDILICTEDSTVAATSSNVDTVKKNWVIIQNNVDGAVFKSTNTFTDGQVLVADGTAGKIKTSGYTIAKSVPSNAVFTDTNYYHTSGSWNGLTYTATANGGAGVLAFTLPTGTTATTVAVGNHEHTIYPKWQTTTKKSTELYDYGFYVNQNQAAGTGPTAGNYFTIFNVPYRKASGNTKADYGWQIGGSTSNDSRLFYRTSGDNVWGNWQEIAHGAIGTAVGSATQPVYMSNTGVITAGTALKALAYKDSLTASDVGAATASHTHGNITNDGKIGTTANRAVYTTTNGVITAGSLPMAAGGTGATDAATARTNLGIPANYMPYAHYSNTGSNSVNHGKYYKININSTQSWMLSFIVRVYHDYNAFDILVSGYQYGSNHWHSPQASLIGKTVGPYGIDVLFGYDSANHLWIAIPAGGYTGLDIINVTNGYTQITNLEGLFTIALVDSAPTTLQTTIHAKFGSNSVANNSNDAGFNIAGGLAVAKNAWIGGGHTAASATNNSSQLIISSHDTAAGGDVALELWRGTNASWQIANVGGNLHFRTNYTTAKQTTYSVDAINMAYNTGNITFKGEVTAPTFKGNLDWSYIQNKPTFITTDDFPLVRGTAEGSFYNADIDSSVGNALGQGSYILPAANNVITAINSGVFSGGGASIAGNFGNLVLATSINKLSLTGAANATVYDTAWLSSTYKEALELFIGRAIVKTNGSGSTGSVITAVDASGTNLKFTLSQTLSSSALSSNGTFGLGGATVTGTKAASNVIFGNGLIYGDPAQNIFVGGGLNAVTGAVNFVYGSRNINTGGNFVSMIGTDLRNSETSKTLIIGTFNEEDTVALPHAFVIGGGVVDARKNIFSVDKEGNVDKVNDITLADNATLHYNSTTESLDFIFA